MFGDLAPNIWNIVNSSKFSTCVAIPNKLDRLIFGILGLQPRIVRSQVKKILGGAYGFLRSSLSLTRFHTPTLSPPMTLVRLLVWLAICFFFISAVKWTAVCGCEI